MSESKESTEKVTTPKRVTLPIPPVSVRVPTVRPPIRAPTIRAPNTTTPRIIVKPPSVTTTPVTTTTTPKIIVKPPTIRLRVNPAAELVVTETEDEVIAKALERAKSRLSPFQLQILEDCIIKGSTILSVPMGTGKTLISIILGLTMAKPGERVLVVVSKTLINNWLHEIEKFFGSSLSVDIVHNDYSNVRNWVPKGKLILTTPEVIARAYSDNRIEDLFTRSVQPPVFGPAIKWYNEVTQPYLVSNELVGTANFYSTRWSSVIIDEVHSYVNLNTARCCGLASLCANHRWALSGTPLAEPRANKIFALYLLVDKGYFPRNLPDFSAYISSGEYAGMSDIMVIREKNEDFTPPTTERIIKSHLLSREEEIVYTQMRTIILDLHKELVRLKATGSDRVRDFNGRLLAMLSHARQAITCPLIPITNMAIDCVAQEQKNNISEIFMRHLNVHNLTEWLNDTESLCSTRLKTTYELFDTHLDRKLVVFSCYTKVLQVVKHHKGKYYQDRPLWLMTGDMSIKKRALVIKEFSESTNGIICMTYDLGSNGINLQVADTVILIDFGWNADRAEQAVSRVLRPGQKSDTVKLYYLASNTGIESALLKIHKAKRQVGDEVKKGAIKTTIPKAVIKDIIKVIQLESNITGIENLVIK